MTPTAQCHNRSFANSKLTEEKRGDMNIHEELQVIIDNASDDLKPRLKEFAEELRKDETYDSQSMKLVFAWNATIRPITGIHAIGAGSKDDNFLFVNVLSAEGKIRSVMIDTDLEKSLQKIQLPDLDLLKVR